MDALQGRVEQFLTKFGHEVCMRLVSSTWRENDFIGLLKDVQCSLELPEGRLGLRDSGA